jgi:hypothetical protein
VFRLATALLELAKSFVVRPVKLSKKQPSKLHWTKFDKPIDKMTEIERRAASERIADEMLGVVSDQDKKEINS